MEIKEQYITLSDLRFYSYHGVKTQERIVGAWYTVDIKISADLTGAIKSDNIEHTINYAAVTRVIKEEMATPSNLLEHVAGRIIKRLYQEFPVQSVTVSIAKENPPVDSPCAQAKITITSRQ